jgi:hypothetical protein
MTLAFHMQKPTAKESGECVVRGIPGIRKCKFGWIGQTLRKNDAGPSKAALQWNPQGIRKRGRPRNSWRRSTLCECGSRSWSELWFIAGDKRKWKDFVDNLYS